MLLNAMSARSSAMAATRLALQRRISIPGSPPPMPFLPHFLTGVRPQPAYYKPAPPGTMTHSGKRPERLARAALYRQAQRVPERFNLEHVEFERRLYLPDQAGMLAAHAPLMRQFRDILERAFMRGLVCLETPARRRSRRRQLFVGPIVLCHGEWMASGMPPRNGRLRAEPTRRGAIFQ